jgi:hypothetical protein
MFNPMMLFIDEGFGCIDKDNFVDTMHCLSVIKNMFNSIVIISHQDQVKNISDIRMHVHHKNDISKLTYGCLDEDEKKFQEVLDRHNEQKEIVKTKKTYAKKQKDERKKTKADERKIILEKINKLDISKICYLKEGKLLCAICEKTYKKGSQKKLDRHVKSKLHESKLVAYFTKLSNGGSRTI